MTPPDSRSADGGSPGPGSSEPAQASGDRPPATLLERDTDLAVLRGLVKAASEGNGSLAAIEGSAGIGKTRLLAEARAMADELGFRVLRARGGELEREFAFGIVRQLFEPLVATASAEERAELFAGAAGLAAPLFGEAGLAEAPATGEASFAMLHGLYWLAANAAYSRPTLLQVDDLHWGDAPSLRWLDHMVRRLEGLPLMLAVATRPPEQGESGVLLNELLMDAGAVVLRPGMLRVESVPILAADVFLATPDEAFCRACHEATGGNPLYLRALLMTLAVDGHPPTAESSARVREVGPEVVTRAVALRLSRLPPEVGALARAIAVLGQTAELGLAAALAGIERSVAVTASGELVRADLLRLEPALDFTHPVVRAAIYEAIGTLERAESHRRAAGLLAEAGAEPERAASHLLLVPPAADPFAVSVLRDASRRALARGAAGEAAVYLRRALAEPPAPAERGDMLGELGVIERNIDLPAAIDHLREAVGLIQEPQRYADVSLEYGRALTYAGVESAAAIAAYRAVIDRAGQERPAVAEVAAAELINASWADGANIGAAKELMAGVRESELAGGFASDFLRALLAHFEVRRGVDRTRASELARRAVTGGTLDNESTQGIYYALDALRATGDHERALAGYASALEAARRRGDLLNVGGLMGFRAWLLLDRGELRAAEPDVRESIEFSAEHGAAVHVMYSAVFLSDYLLEVGAVAEAEGVLARAGMPEQLPDNFHFVIFLGARGRLRLAQRKPEAALGDFEAIRRIAEQVDLFNPAEWPWRTGAATALVALGRTEEARELAAEELELARRWGDPRPVGFALRTLGLAEAGAAGEERLRESEEVLAPSTARLEHAKTLVELGAAVRRRGERNEARELLQQGADVAGRCGATALVERANGELAATGARPRKVSLSGLDSLTASERRVAQLAAEELSNKEIAQALFVTVKTVEVHLSNVYRKLGIASRRELPVALVEEHAVPA